MQERDIYKLIFSKYTVKKEKKIFLIAKGIQKGSGVNSYIGLLWAPDLIYKEIRKYLTILYTRRPLVIYDYALDPLLISVYMRKIFFIFYQCKL